MKAHVTVKVIRGDVTKALKRLKRRVGAEGVIAAMRNKESYKKPSEQRRSKARKALARARKLAKRL